MANVQTTTEFGVYHLADNPKSYQPMRRNNFVFLVQNFEGDKVLKIDGDANNSNDYISNVQEILQFSVKSFDVPHFSQNALEINRGNSKLRYAGKAEYRSPLNLVVQDFVGVNTKSILEAWQALSYDPVNDTIARSDIYKKDCTVIEYLPDNTMVRYWDIKGCWISQISEDNWNNDDAGLRTVTAQIVYDYAIPHQADETYLG